MRVETENASQVLKEVRGRDSEFKRGCNGYSLPMPCRHARGDQLMAVLMSEMWKS